MKKITYSKTKGSSLIEVMVALLVMAIGLLGVLAMQTKAVLLNQNAYLYSQAAFLANDIVEAMQSSGTSLNFYPTGYDIPSASVSDAGSCDTANCSQLQLARWNVQNWKTNVENYLPGGQAQIVAHDNGDSGYSVSVRFKTGTDLDGDPVHETVTLRTGF